MKIRAVLLFTSLLSGLAPLTRASDSVATTSPKTPPKIPRFSISYMDRSISPRKNFYRFADGNWIKNNPIPPDQTRWTSISELARRNWVLIYSILTKAEMDKSQPRNLQEREVGDFFASAMGTKRIEKIGLKPIASDLARIADVQNHIQLFDVAAHLQNEGIGCLFDASVAPDERESRVYAFYLMQGGLTLPNRNYYLEADFASVRKQYLEHITRMLLLIGEKPDAASHHAQFILNLESALARACRTTAKLRSPEKNYNRFTLHQLVQQYPDIPWNTYMRDRGLENAPYFVVRQPEFFATVDDLLKQAPLSAWKTYLRWKLLHASAPFLPKAVADENFSFFRKVLSGQKEPRPRWKRAANVISHSIGDALGKLYVEKYFPPAAKVRIDALVNNLKAVFRDHLKEATWMTASTRAKALEKFDRFTQKIGYPEQFRDYSSVIIRRDDYLGNVRRAATFDVHQDLVRVGKPVDRKEWDMTPKTINAYFSDSENEIVFPAAILQPPFFDMKMDDAVNYGAIGVVIGHEITHGFDDRGRKFDANGNLHNWWSPTDIKAFNERAQKLVTEYDSFEPLPGFHVNGEQTLSENIADLGGVTIAFDALERDLAKHPLKRKTIDGFTPEQRFFISYAQLCRAKIRKAEARRLLLVDVHAPTKFRAIGTFINLQAFDQAFDIRPSDPMWRPVGERAKIW